MPEDNYLECVEAIAETMRDTARVGEWYGKCFFCVFLEMFTFEFSSDLRQEWTI